MPRKYKKREKKLTRLRRLALRFICEFINENGASPSNEEVRVAMGYNSQFQARRVIKDLIDLGYIEQRWHQRRGICIPDIDNLPDDLYVD